MQIILKRQADRTIPWDQALGRLVETAWDDGRLDDAAKADYLLNGFGLRLEARPDTRQGDALPVQFGYDFRFGGQGNFQIFVEPLVMTLGEYAVDPLPRQKRSGGNGSSAVSNGVNGSWLSAPTQATPQQTGEWKAGRYLLAAEVRVTAGPAKIGGDVPENADLPEVVVSRTLTLTAPVHVRPRGEPENLFTVDPAVAAVIDRYARVSPVGPPAARYLTRLPLAVWIALPEDDAGVPFDLQIFRRAADGDTLLPRQLLGITYRTAPDGTMLKGDITGITLPPGAADAGRVTLVLKPDADAARLRTDGRKPWGCEIVFPDVPVTAKTADGESGWYGTDGQKKP